MGRELLAESGPLGHKEELPGTRALGQAGPVRGRGWGQGRGRVEGTRLADRGSSLTSAPCPAGLVCVHLGPLSAG